MSDFANPYSSIGKGLSVLLIAVILMGAMVGASSHGVNSCNDENDAITSGGDYTINESITSSSSPCLKIDAQGESVTLNQSDSVTTGINMTYTGEGSDSEGTAIYVANASHVEIDGVTIAAADIGVDAKANVTVKNSKFEETRIAVYLDNTDGSIVKDNTATYWHQDGEPGASIHLESTTDAVVDGNQVTGPGAGIENQSGVWASDTSGSEIITNKVSKYESAVSLNETQDSIVYDNEMSNSLVGIVSKASDSSVVAENTVYETQLGLYLRDIVGSEYLRNEFELSGMMADIDAVHETDANLIQQNEFTLYNRVDEPMRVTEGSQAQWNANFYGFYNQDPRTPYDVKDFFDCSDENGDGICDERGIYLAGPEIVDPSQDGINIDANPLHPSGTEKETVLVDDQNPTTTDYPVDIAAANNVGEITLDLHGVANHVYELMNSTHSIGTASEAFDVGSNIVNDRYEMIDTDSSFGQQGHLQAIRGHVIDIIETDKNTVGRVLAQDTGFGSPMVEVRDWLTLEKEQTLDISGSGDDWKGYADREEKLYELDVQSDQAWIGVHDDNHASTFTEYDTAPQQVNVNDIELEEPVTINGTVQGNYSSTTWENVVVEARRLSSEMEINRRAPYINKPPVKNATTNASGEFAITNLMPGTYQLRIVDANVSRTSGSFFDPDVQYQEFEADPVGVATANLVATNRTGNLTVNMTGDTGENIRYGLQVMRANGDTKPSFMLPEMSVGGTRFDTLPNGTYNLAPLQFKYEDGRLVDVVPPPTGPKQVQIKAGAMSYSSFSYPTTVSINGTIVNSTGHKITDEAIEYGAFNEEQRLRHFGATENGELELNVQNETLYQIGARPIQEDSAYRMTMKGPLYLTEYNKTTLNGGVTIQMQEGVAMDGTVTDENGDGINARVIAYSESPRVSGEAKTNENGEFTIPGLVNETTYNVIVDPRNSTHERNRTQVSNWDTTQSVDLGVTSPDTYELAVTVTDENGNWIDAEVQAYSEMTGEIEQDVDGSAVLSNNVRGRTYVHTYVEGRGDERRRISIDEDRNLTFSFATPKTVSGYINDENGMAVSEGEGFIAARNRSLGSFDWDEAKKSGGYELQLEEGGHRIQYGVKGSGIVDGTMQVNGSDNFRNVSLPDRQNLAGSINDTDGNDVSGELALWNRSARSFVYEEFEDGEYNISGLKDVGHNVLIRPDSDTLAEKRTNVSKSEVTGQNLVNFTVSGGTGQDLEVEVVDQTGNPISGTTITTNESEMMTDENGTATFTTFDAGETIGLRIQKPGYTGVKDTVSIGNPADIETAEVKTEQYQLDSTDTVEVEAKVTKNSDAVDQVSLVLVKKDETDSGSGVTDDTGNTTIANITEGKYNFILALGEGEVIEDGGGPHMLSAGGSGDITDLGPNSNYKIKYGVELQ